MKLLMKGLGREGGGGGGGGGFRPPTTPAPRSNTGIVLAVVNCGIYLVNMNVLPYSVAWELCTQMS